MPKPKIAFVIQRYHPEIVGGAELQCRSYAEFLATKEYDVEVLTSCSLDYQTWKNHYPPGLSEINGVVIRRFPASDTRHPQFDRWWEIWAKRPRTQQDEIQWLYEQGPVMPELLAYSTAHGKSYELFIFFTYLYFPTAVGLRPVANKAILVPTANPGEPPLGFRCFHDLFFLPKMIIYTTEEERDYVHRKFGNKTVPSEILGFGLNPITSDKPQRFKERFGLTKGYVLFLGRVGPNKGCDYLIECFQHYLEYGGSDFHLVVAGSLEMEIPRHDDIRYVGVLHGQDKTDALAGASAMINPSRFDCLSIMSCEAWAAAKPVFATARSPVLSSLCQRSKGGTVFDSPGDFAKLLQRLAQDPEWGKTMGKRGQKFIMRHYGLEKTERKLEKIVRMNL